MFNSSNAKKSAAIITNMILIFLRNEPMQLVMSTSCLSFIFANCATIRFVNVVYRVVNVISNANKLPLNLYKKSESSSAMNENKPTIKESRM